MTLRLEIAGELVQLLASRALFRERNRTLYVADLHVGKAATFRAERIAIPTGTTSLTLERLAQTIAATGASRLVVLGDFFHARVGRHPGTIAELNRWRAAHASLLVQIVRGNHDRHAGDPDDELNALVHDAPLHDDGWQLHHHPAPNSDLFWLAGHVHPAVSLRGRGRQSLFLPCFHLTATGMVLPSFGEFTGKGGLAPAADDRVFVVAGDDVIETAGRLQ